MIVSNLDELIKLIECAQMSECTDPNEFLRYFPVYREFGFEFLDFYGWIIVAKNPYLDNPHIDTVSSPRTYTATMIDKTDALNPRVYSRECRDPLVHHRYYISSDLAKWLYKRTYCP